MKLKILTDNNTFIDKYLIGEPALSFLIETEGKRILFDLGYSNVFMKNAITLKEDLSDIDYLVLSHGHNDHTWGLSSLIPMMNEQRKHSDYLVPTLIGHPLVFEKKIHNQCENIGSLITKETASIHFNLKLSKDPIWITEKLVFLGEIERKTDFESKTSIGKTLINGNMVEDFLLDDSALAYKSSEGLIIITGCSHSGICNIIQKAKEVCEENKVLDIIGGFHLLSEDAFQLEKTAEYINNNKISKIHPSHCTDLNSKIRLSKVTNVIETGCGLILEY